MTVSSTRPAATRTIQREIVGQMKDLPLDGLVALRDFVVSLRQRAPRNQVSPQAFLRQPTVEMPADSLLRLLDLLPPVGGDALADTEALYDQV